MSRGKHKNRAKPQKKLKSYANVHRSEFTRSESAREERATQHKLIHDFGHVASNPDDVRESKSKQIIGQPGNDRKRYKR